MKTFRIELDPSPSMGSVTVTVTLDPNGYPHHFRYGFADTMPIGHVLEQALRRAHMDRASADWKRALKTTLAP